MLRRSSSAAARERRALAPPAAMQPASHTVNMPPHEPRQLYGPAPFYPHVVGGVIQPPRDYVVWSLFNFTACNCCFVGFIALIFSIKARDCKVIGDPEGAARYGRTARLLNIAAFMLSVIIFLGVITGIASSRHLINTKLRDLIRNEDELDERGR
ncbi:dispanin subfamily A member 2b-like [Elgaria multicarinata webbii]|uniref:dispanin subfamily A member 2b-like n=1 Tax=Elgaria multicarinata webbii TaxID=159646 RepID=UPI002FCCBB34